MLAQEQQVWDLWIPDVGATGISFARGRLDATEVIIVHDLPRTTNSPMARLRRQGNKITREDIWPTEADYGTLVIVAGGEVGTLQKWWNDAEQQEWRWSLEFYNHR